MDILHAKALLFLHQASTCTLSLATKAVMLTMPRVVVEETRTCTGFDMPSSIGPIGSPRVIDVASVSATLAVSSDDMTSRLAAPSSVDRLTLLARIAALSALSACISPSMARSGACCRITKEAFVFPAKLRATLIADSERYRSCVGTPGNQATARFLKPDVLLVLQRA